MSAAVDEEVLVARALLNRVAEPADLDLWLAVRSDGPVDVARTILSGRSAEFVTDSMRARAREADPLADIEAAARHGVRLVVPESGEWPHFALGALEAAGLRLARRRSKERRTIPEDRRDGGVPVPPLVLWVRGPLEPSDLAVRSVAVVGSRACSPYGRSVTSAWCGDLAARGFTIVSGGALGIDGVAHRAALDVGGATVLVSAGGLDRAYPPAHAALFEQVSRAGLCISESPPGCAPRRYRFLSRNRLIAAFGTGTIVMEAAHRSGALNTANHCVELGRPLMALPGPVDSPASAGCHRLIARECGAARLVATVQDVLDAIGSAGEGSDAGEPSPPDQHHHRLDALEATARRVFDAFPARGWIGVDRLALASGLPVSSVLSSLPALESSGLVRSGDPGYRLNPAARKEPTS